MAPATRAAPRRSLRPSRALRRANQAAAAATERRPAKAANRPMRSRSASGRGASREGSLQGATTSKETGRPRNAAATTCRVSPPPPGIGPEKPAIASKGTRGSQTGSEATNDFASSPASEKSASQTGGAEVGGRGRQRLRWDGDERAEASLGIEDDREHPGHVERRVRPPDLAADVRGQERPRALAILEDRRFPPSRGEIARPARLSGPGEVPEVRVVPERTCAPSRPEGPSIRGAARPRAPAPRGRRAASEAARGRGRCPTASARLRDRGGRRCRRGAPRRAPSGITPSGPAAATISGDGVSPAASAAASGSPPGSAAATCTADDGRARGSFSRQRRMTRSTAGSKPARTFDGAVGVSCSCLRRISASVGASNARLPVATSYRTRPSA